MYKYRVFISYSHDNKEDVETIAKILEKNNLIPVYDADLPGGFDFNDLLKRYIEHSHVFMPLITAESAQRGWVHQEIGYAMAMNIPVLPVAKETLPSAMIQRLHAISLDNDISLAESKLSYNVFHSLVENCSSESATYYCTEQPEKRAMMMARIANDVKMLGYDGVVRQLGGITSFQIPDKPVSNRVWTERYTKNNDTVLKNDFHCECQRAERKALESHARAAGCKLIINPNIILEKYSKIAQRARLSTLLDFLKSMPDNMADIVINEKMTFSESVTIVGDWFSAESYYRSESQGFMQTIFTRYAPGIKEKMDLFDSEFEALLEENNTELGKSLPKAIKIIEGMLADIS